ncbi:hypothetical protein LJC31_06215 [Synergistaceae bacterium OttesenSCG-928-I11]|nr:hypothetical protein [Synergistaceae bacterium OttesenSCG-928-I11]
MTNAQIFERKTLYRRFRRLSDEKAALAIAYIRSLEHDDEPALTANEEEGLLIANAELARGEGRPFKEAMEDLW